MKNTPTPYAALIVVTVTAAVFVYFSCAGSSNDPNATASVAGETFGKDLPDDGRPFDPLEAGLTPVLAKSCPDVSQSSRLCEDQTPSDAIGK